MSDLNLLPSEAKFQAEKIRLKRLASNFSWLISGIWLIIVIVLFGLNLLAQLNENQLNKKYKKIADQYKDMSQEILKNQQVKHQAKVVAMVLKERFEYGSSMEKIKNIFSENVVINNFNLESGKIYKVEAVVPEPKNLDEVELRINDINQGKIEGFKSASLNNLTIDGIKGWKFVMEVSLI